MGLVIQLAVCANWSPVSLLSFRIVFSVNCLCKLLAGQPVVFQDCCFSHLSVCIVFAGQPAFRQDCLFSQLLVVAAFAGQLVAVQYVFR